MPDATRELWVFAYGSLMWQPGFASLEARPARLAGYHRSLCVYSVHYRGSARRPGLVLGLDRGGCCEGYAFRVGGRQAAAVRCYLRRRELVYGVYREVSVPVALRGEDGRLVPALTYVAERCHPSYAGRLPLARQARIVLAAQGRAGTNIDYVLNTLLHLEDLGLRDRGLERLGTLVGRWLGHGRRELTQRPRAKSMARSRQRTGAPVRSIAAADRARFTFRARLASGWSDG